MGQSGAAAVTWEFYEEMDEILDKEIVKYPPPERLSGTLLESQPSTSQPSTSQPSTSQPSTSQPSTSQLQPHNFPHHSLQPSTLEVKESVNDRIKKRKRSEDPPQWFVEYCKKRDQFWEAKLEEKERTEEEKKRWDVRKRMEENQQKLEKEKLDTINRILNVLEKSLGK